MRVAMLILCLLCVGMSLMTLTGLKTPFLVDSAASVLLGMVRT